MKTHNFGNNEILSTGITADGSGFLAMTLTQSKTFKTFKGAERWLAARGYKANGDLLVESSTHRR